MTGLSPEEIWEKDKHIFDNAFKQLLGRLKDKELIKGIINEYNIVQLGSESKLHAKYKEVMRFHYSGNKAICADPVLQEMRRQYRLMVAHLDRRSVTAHFLFLVPHLLKPEEFGEVKDCEICKQIEVGSVGQKIIDEIVQNRGPYSPSRASAEPHAPFHTYLQAPHTHTHTHTHTNTTRHSTQQQYTQTGVLTSSGGHRWIYSGRVTSSHRKGICKGSETGACSHSGRKSEQKGEQPVSKTQKMPPLRLL
jgi:hypothetical protein